MMTEMIEAFYRSLRGRRVAFIGTGVTNQQCIELFSRCGAEITLCDKKPDLEAFGPYAERLRGLNIRYSLGERYLDGLAGQEMIMRTPGFEYYTPQLVAAREAGVECTSEMELFFRLCPCKTVAVTGSDGKTTTTTLIAKMLETAGRRVHLGGNLGRALLPIVDTIEPDDIAVVELSSFQLISMRQSIIIRRCRNISTQSATFCFISSRAAAPCWGTKTRLPARWRPMYGARSNGLRAKAPWKTAAFCARTACCALRRTVR